MHEPVQTTGFRTPLTRSNPLDAAMGLIVALMLFMFMFMALPPSVLAESADPGTDEATPSEDSATPPPGSLHAEGMVPAEGVGGPAEPEAIGHVPGPDEGVYGDPPNSGRGNPEGRGWAYDWDYFFALTRGLEEAADLSRNGRRWVTSLTLPMDVVTLPTAALAGLSGRAPKADTNAADTDAHGTDDAGDSPDTEESPPSGADPAPASS